MGNKQPKRRSISEQKQLVADSEQFIDQIYKLLEPFHTWLESQEGKEVPMPKVAMDKIAQRFSMLYYYVIGLAKGTQNVKDMLTKGEWKECTN